MVSVSSLQRNLTFLDKQIVSFCTRNMILAVQLVPSIIATMSTPLCFLMFGLIAMRPVEGTRLDRLEEELKALKGFIFKELGYIRDDVKEIAYRVDILENTTVTHDPSSPYQDIGITSYNLDEKNGDSGKLLVRDGNNEGSHVVIAEVQNMRKAYANDKKDLHQLKQDVKGQLRDIELKITSHMHNLTADVQQNIDLVSVIRTNFSEVPTQITNLSLQLKLTEKEIKDAEERLRICIHTKVSIQDGYYFPCAKDIRLANASPYRSTGVQGRLEVRHDNTWGTVCDNSFELGQVRKQDIENNVNVVCRMFGFQECKYVRWARLGRGSGYIWMDRVKCGGRESSFLECPHLGWGVHICSLYEDIGFLLRIVGQSK
ncbi:C163A-like protein, partial [Mya arenaria]